MTTPTPCPWFGLPALPLNEATISEFWAAGECTLRVFGPLGVLSVSVHDSPDDWCPPCDYEVMVQLSPDCGLLNEKGKPFGDERIPDEVLTALEDELIRSGYCPDGPVEFARRATPAQRELALAWARENVDQFDEAAAVLDLLSDEQEPETYEAPDDYYRVRLGNIWGDDESDLPLGLAARRAV